MNNTQYKRRNFFVKKNFQGKLILGYFLFMMGGGLLFIAILAAFSGDSLTIAYQNHDLQLGQTPLILLRKVLMAHWIFVVPGGVLLVIATMFITHRMAGPQFRFEKALDNMIAGRLDDTIYLRNKDEGKELAAKLNCFNMELSQKIETIDKNARKVDDLLQQYSLLDPKSVKPEDLDMICRSITLQNAEIRKITKSFTLLNE
ncbi:MAG: methyl-accepting chemotaxis protein [Pseudomonadota bacterium]